MSIILWSPSMQTLTARTSFHAFANPGRFLRLVRPFQPWLAAATVLLFAAGLYFALWASPPDYQQGETVRIMYIHVPAAWMSLMVYSLIGGASAVYLIWRHPLADMVAQASALIGAAFTLLTLITGSLWGKPTWGTWWVWDARLTSVLILFFLYLGYMALRSGEESERAAKAAAILALVGLVNLPIIKFSVEWWNTLHQPASIIRSGGSAVDPSMELPLYLMAGAYFCFYLSLLLVRVRSLVVQRKIRRLQSAFF